MRNKWKYSLLVGLLLMGAMGSVAEAGNLDTYRNLVTRGTYTIKYENITPLPRVTNKDKIDIYGYSGMAIDKNDYFTNRQITGVLVSDGDDKFEEVGNGDYNMCRLTKDKETFTYSRYKQKGSWQFFGNKKGKVEAVKVNVLAELTSGISYGDPDMTKALSVLLPDHMKSAGTTKFQYVTSGWLPNGLNYEDYQSVDSNNLEAIRYYFNGYTLVKIAYANSLKDDKGRNIGRKFVINIKEFSPTPDKALLVLPEGLKDTTKRDVKEDEEE